MITRKRYDFLVLSIALFLSAGILILLALR